MAPSCPRYFFVFFYPEYLAFGSVRHEPCPTTNFFFSFFRWREEGATSVFRVPANHLASTFFLPVSGDPREVTEYKHLFLTVILWRLATVNSNTRIVVILFPSSQWDTPWQLHECCWCWKVIFHWGKHELQHVLWNTAAEYDPLPPKTGSQGSVPAWQWLQIHLQDDHCFTEEVEVKAGQACLLTWTQ